MGNEASRVCKLPLAKFTRIQRLSGGSTAKVNHIKGRSFEQLVPGEGGASSSEARPLTEDRAPVSEGGIEIGPTSEGADSTVVPGELGATSSEDRVDPFQKSKSQGSLGRSQGMEDGLRPHQAREVRGDGETKRIRKSQGEDPKARQSTASCTSKVGGTNSAKDRVHGDQLHSGGAIGRPFPKRPIGCKLSSNAWSKLEQLFRLMDEDGSNAVTREEAKVFFHGAFSNLSVDAMFNEVDVDGSGAITADEFVKFWLQVRSSGYKEQEILEELDELIEGGAWRDWKDGRDTVAHEVKFPKRPFMCRLSSNGWSKCEELFHKISGNDDRMQITRDKAQHFFKGAFCNISADAMFNEIDLNHHGVITPKEFMKFWVQLRAHGYKEKDIVEEIDNLMEGSPWVDWKDGRRT